MVWKLWDEKLVGPHSKEGVSTLLARGQCHLKNKKCIKTTVGLALIKILKNPN